MTAAVAIVAGLAVLTSGALAAWCLWLDDRRRRDRDAELVGEVRVAHRAVTALAAQPRPRPDVLVPDDVTP